MQKREQLDLALKKEFQICVNILPPISSMQKVIWAKNHHNLSSNQAFCMRCNAENTKGKWLRKQIIRERSKTKQFGINRKTKPHFSGQKCELFIQFLACKKQYGLKTTIYLSSNQLLIRQADIKETHTLSRSCGFVFRLIPNQKLHSTFFPQEHKLDAAAHLAVQVLHGTKVLFWLGFFTPLFAQQLGLL